MQQPRRFTACVFGRWSYCQADFGWHVSCLCNLGWWLCQVLGRQQIWTARARSGVSVSATGECALALIFSKQSGCANQSERTQCAHMSGLVLSCALAAHLHAHRRAYLRIRLRIHVHTNLCTALAGWHVCISRTCFLHCVMHNMFLGLANVSFYRIIMWALSETSVYIHVLTGLP